MRYDSARLTGFSDTAVKERKAGFDTPFFLLVLLLLTMGVVMVLSASFPRATSPAATPPIILYGSFYSPFWEPEPCFWRQKYRWAFTGVIPFIFCPLPSCC